MHTYYKSYSSAFYEAQTSEGRGFLSEFFYTLPPSTTTNQNAYAACGIKPESRTWTPDRLDKSPAVNHAKRREQGSMLCSEDLGAVWITNHALVTLLALSKLVVQYILLFLKLGSFEKPETHNLFTLDSGPGLGWGLGLEALLAGLGLGLKNPGGYH
ncbi:hypothetical protein K438DRAFT_1791792 [Mycena galopus ATCC 62051]|nr:hypothetical protein K438DRAFT_1791792 [Mycena galopus ATCC 62051]